MCIECLWVDVTAQVVATWSDIFMALELQHGFDINNMYHISLLHHIFLSLTNQQLQFFLEVCGININYKSVMALIAYLQIYSASI